MTDEQRDDLRDLEDALVHLLEALQRVSLVKANQYVFSSIATFLYSAESDIWKAHDGIRRAIYYLQKQEAEK